MTTTDSDLAHVTYAAQERFGEVGPNSAPASVGPTPRNQAPVRSDFPADHHSNDAQSVVVGGDQSSDIGQDIHVDQSAFADVAPSSTDSHDPYGSHSRLAVGAATPEAATPGTPPPRAQLPLGDPMVGALPGEVPDRPGEPKDSPPAAAIDDASTSLLAPLLADPFLALAADVLDDLERVRIANENRYRQLTRSAEDSDGEERGFGLTEDHPDVARLRGLVDALVKAEHQATLNLERMMRRHPLGPWVKSAKGVGEKQAARLLASIGDPYFNTLHNRPRTVSELWAYAGYHVLRPGHTTFDAQCGDARSGQAGGDLDHSRSGGHDCPVGVAASRARGQRANWSADAKMRAFLVATSIVKCGGPYREVYDEGRAKYADAEHQVECKRCGPSGKPAVVGSPLSAGHQHARALRLVAKAVLRDLWREAKRLHGAHDQITDG